METPHFLQQTEDIRQCFLAALVISGVTKMMVAVIMYEQKIINYI